MARTCLAVVLAAGDATRMKSSKSKVLHTVGNLPLISHVTLAAVTAGVNRIALVVGRDADEVARTAQQGVDVPVTAVMQTERKGTGHAVLMARDIIAEGFDDVVVLVGDAPYSYRFREAQPEDAGTENAEDEIIRTRLDNRAGFVLGFNTSGEPLSAYTVDDAGDLSNEFLTSGVRFDGDIVVSGNTNGSFVEGQAAPVTGTESILARVDTSESGVAFRNWRRQLAFEGLDILDLENYRDDEVVALVNRNGERMLLVFSPEGELLTPITP